MTRRRGRPDENINLHIIKAAAIKAIEIMQIIRKRPCRGNFCRHLKSFRRLLSMNIEQPRTCRSPPPFPIVPSSHLSYHPHFSLRNDFKHELVHHRRPPREITLATNWTGGLRAMNRREGLGERGKNKNDLLKITLSNRWKYSARGRDLVSFNFIPRRILMYIAQSPERRSAHN